jgi:hypothetical protein
MQIETLRTRRFDIAYLVFFLILSLLSVSWAIRTFPDGAAKYRRNPKLFPEWRSTFWNHLWNVGIYTFSHGKIAAANCACNGSRVCVITPCPSYDWPANRVAAHV